MTIGDEPRFAWRGLMLDSARHFQAPEFVKKFIDWMALHKLNVLHWHLTDDQAWRLEIKKYPKLTSVGAWRVPAGHAPANDIDPATKKPRVIGGFYTQDEVRDVIAYAAARNITILPEIEMPGHASAAVVAYPELGVSRTMPKAVPSDWGFYTTLYKRRRTDFQIPRRRAGRSGGTVPRRIRARRRRRGREGRMAGVAAHRQRMKELA